MEIGTYSEARAAGKTRYFTGKPCKSGHIAERIVKTRNCCVCSAARVEAIRLRRMANDPEFVLYRRRKAKEWREANREKRKKTRREWAKKNRGKSNAMHRRWRRKHPEKPKAASARYRKKYPEKAKVGEMLWRAKNPQHASRVRRSISQNRRTRQSSAGGRFGADDVEALLIRQNGICVGCTQLIPPFHVDHIVAVAKGGSSDPSNLQLLCPTCNKSKGAKDMAEWMASRTH